MATTTTRSKKTTTITPPAAPVLTPTGPAVINVFNKAKTSAAGITSKADTKGTTWAISPQPDQATPEQLNTAVSELHRLSAVRKQIATEETIHKNMLEAYGESHLFNTLATIGAAPETPMRIVNDKHQSVTFVVQERGGNCTDEQTGKLVDLLGDRAADLYHESGEFKFNEAIMNQDAPNGESVETVIATAIGEVLGALVTNGKLTQEQAEGLVSYKPSRRFRPGIVTTVTRLCNQNRKKIVAVIDAIGSAVTRYVKP